MEPWFSSFMDHSADVSGIGPAVPGGGLGGSVMVVIVIVTVVRVAY